MIARTTVEWLLFRNWKFRKISLYDVDRKEADQFAGWLRDQHDLPADIQDRLEKPIRGASLVLFTTTTLDPYLARRKLFGHCPTVLHLSLRDICVNVILASQNIVDDVDHCLKASTSLHLAEMATGNRNFVAGNLVDVLDEEGRAGSGQASHIFAVRARRSRSCGRKFRPRGGDIVRRGDRAARLLQQFCPMVKATSPQVIPTRSEEAGCAYVPCVELQRVGSAGGSHRRQSAAGAVSHAGPKHPAGGVLRPLIGRNSARPFSAADHRGDRGGSERIRPDPERSGRSRSNGRRRGRTTPGSPRSIGKPRGTTIIVPATCCWSSAIRSSKPPTSSAAAPRRRSAIARC